MKVVRKVLMLMVFMVFVIAFLEVIPTAPKYKGGHNPWIVGEGNRPLIIPHGGAKALFPENTIYAYNEIARLGYDVFEIDLALTKDNVLITIHDLTNERYTKPGVNMVIREHFYEELMPYNYAYNFERNGEYPFRDVEHLEDGPTLEELRPAKLEALFQTYPNHRYVLELKDTVESSGEETFKAAVHELIRLIDTYDMYHKVIVSSFDDEVIRYVKAESNGRIMTSAASDEVLKFTLLNILRLNFFYSPTDGALIIPIKDPLSKRHEKIIKRLPSFLRKQAAIYDEEAKTYYSNIVNQRMVRDAHRHNMAIIYWTVNEENDMRRLIELGVDGIITDRPDLLKAVLTDMGYSVD